MNPLLTHRELMTATLVRHSTVRALAIAAFVVIAGCNDTETPHEDEHEDDLDGTERGDPGRVVERGELGLAAGRSVLGLVGLEDLEIEHPVELVSAHYHTVDAAGANTEATMLMARPVGCEPVAVVAYQHGTAFHRDEAPSEASAEDDDDRAILAAAFAGHCYLFVAPDYVGLGDSPRRHPFMHAETEASAVIDAWRAAQRIAEDRGWSWPRDVFLFGFSQGGHAALAAVDALPDGLRARAVAAVSGVYNLSSVQLPFTLAGQTPIDSAYLGYIVSAYSAIYAAPAASEYLEPPYDETLDDLFDGSKRVQEIIPEMPLTPQALLKSSFTEQLMTGEDNWFSSGLSDNDVDTVVPSVPVRLYFSSSDTIVSPEQAPEAARRIEAAGGDVQAIDLGEVDHLASGFAALPAVRAWFDEFLE